MRKFKKTLISLALIACVGMGAFGCGKKSTEKTYVDGGTQQEQTKLPYTVVEDKYFVKSGSTDYVIVIPADCDDVIELASTELRDFFLEATGARPEIFRDDQTLPSGKKYFSLGDTKQAKENTNGHGGVGDQGFRLVTKGDNLYVLGNGTHGVIYGVYDLLGLMFNYEFFKEEIYSLDTNVSTLNFFTLDHKETPNFNYRVGYSALSDYNNGIHAMRYRLRSEWEFSAGDIHNSTAEYEGITPVIPRALYHDQENHPDTYHPEWFAVSAGQLCYTAHGDAESLQLMIDTASDFFVDLIKDDKTKTHVYFQMSDNKTWCDCEACVESKAKYNAESAAMLIVCQGIHESITEKLSALGDDRFIKVVPLLYHTTENVPVVKNPETGKYELSDPELDFSGVTPMWANLSVKQHEYAWSHPRNAPALDMLDQMNAAFDNFWIWDYGINFKDYLLPYNVFDNISEDFKLLQNYNIELHLYQCDHTAYNSSGFGALKQYLITQLGWDPEQDINELTDKFFAAVYGDGAPAIRKIYDQYRVLAAYNSVDHGKVVAWEHGVYAVEVIKPEYWPKGLLRDWLGYVDDALAAVEHVKATDPEKYKWYEWNISSDALFVKYVYAMLYMTDSKQENVDYKVALYNEAVRLNFNTIRESSGGIWMLAMDLEIGSYLQ